MNIFNDFTLFSYCFIYIQLQYEIIKESNIITVSDDKWQDCITEVGRVSVTNSGLNILFTQYLVSENRELKETAPHTLSLIIQGLLELCQRKMTSNLLCIQVYFYLQLIAPLSNFSELCNKHFPELVLRWWLKRDQKTGNEIESTESGLRE